MGRCRGLPIPSEGGCFLNPDGDSIKFVEMLPRYGFRLRYERSGRQVFLAGKVFMTLMILIEEVTGILNRNDLGVG